MACTGHEITDDAIVIFIERGNSGKLREFDVTIQEFKQLFGNTYSEQRMQDCRDYIEANFSGIAEAILVAGLVIVWTQQRFVSLEIDRTVV